MKYLDNVVPIYNRNVDPTVASIQSSLAKWFRVSEDYFHPVGSTGKNKWSGDIDLAFQTDLTVAAVADILLSEVHTEVHTIPSLGIVSIPWDVVSADGTPNGQRVQVDLIPTRNFEWTLFIYDSPPEGASKYKGAHRNILLSAIATHLNFQVLEERDGEPVVFVRNFIDLREGLMRGIQTRLGKNGNLLANGRKRTLSRYLVSSDPLEICRLLFWERMNPLTAYSFEMVLKCIDSKVFIHSDKREAILKTAAETFQRIQKFGMPEELQDYV